MAFSRVHYVAIAKLIAEATKPEAYTQTGGLFYIDKAQLVSDLSELFQRDNARFDEARFIDACYHNG